MPSSGGSTLSTRSGGSVQVTTTGANVTCQRSTGMEIEREPAIGSLDLAVTESCCGVCVYAKTGTTRVRHMRLAARPYQCRIGCWFAVGGPAAATFHSTPSGSLTPLAPSVPAALRAWSRVLDWELTAMLRCPLEACVGAPKSFPAEPCVVSALHAAVLGLEPYLTP